MGYEQEFLRWSFLGTYVFPVFIASIIGALLLLVLGLVFKEKSHWGDRYYMRGPFVYGSIGLGIVAVIVGLILLIDAWPLDPEYQRIYQISGTVTEIESRMLADGEGMSEFYAVQYGPGEVFRCDDTRCSLVEPGDTLVLECQKLYQFRGTDGWDCSFREHITASP